VSAAGMAHAELVLGRGSNPGIARAERHAPAEAANLRAFFAATRRGMVATLRYQAEARGTDLLWQPAEVARATIEVIERVRPDAIVVDHLAFGATIGLRAAGVAYIDVVLGHPRQLPVGDETYGVPGAWPAAFDVDESELADLRSVARTVADRFSDAYNRALASVSASASPVDDALAAHGALVLFNYPRDLHGARRTAVLPEGHAFLGANLRDERPPADVAAWLEREPDRRIVLVSLGTFLSVRDDVLAVIAEGLRRLDVRVALATGSTDPARLGRLPDDWLVAPYLPQVSILRRAGALVTHAGNNSVTEALAHGVPMLALPFSTDQFDGAAAIEAAGLGAAADPNDVGPADVAAAVEQLIRAPAPALERLAAELSARSGGVVARAAVADWLQAGELRPAGGASRN
jgi:zeaxanthin glucosyltransferase